MGLFTEEELTLCAEDSPARTSRSQGKVLASKVSGADYGSTCSGLFEKPDLVGSSLRTSLLSIIAELTSFSADWKRRGTPAGRSWWVLTTWARPTDASGFGSWATPNAGDQIGSHGGGQGRSLRTDIYNLRVGVCQTPTRATGEHPGRVKLKEGQQDCLSMQVNRQGVNTNWPTPDATNGYENTLRKDTNALTGGNHSVSLGQKVRIEQWPTPTTQDGENNGSASQMERNSPPLNVAAKWPTPTAMTETGGLAACKWGGSGSRKMLKKTEPVMMFGQLSPAWVTQLMGFPDGWLDGLPAPENRSMTGKRPARPKARKSGQQS